MRLSSGDRHIKAVLSEGAGFLIPISHVSQTGWSIDDLGYMHWDKTLLWIRHIFKSLTASLLVAFFLVSCGGKEPVDPTPTPGPGPDPKPPVETKDTKAPTITVKITEKNVIAWVVVSVKDNQLLFDQDVAATWTDDISKSCKLELSLVPSNGSSKTINSGEKLEEAGTLQIRVIDEAGNSSSAEIKLTLSDTKAPEIEVKISEKNVVAGVKISVQDNQLFFDQDVAATWKDDYSEAFTTELYLFVDGCEPETINSGDVITKAGVFKIHVTDEFGNKSVAEITFTAIAVYGLENLQGKTLQIDQEVNILDGITFAEGLTLVKVEVEENGVRTEIANPNAYIPQVTGQVNIIFTLARTDGSTIEVMVDGITVMGITYHALEIIDVFGKDYLPQVERWDTEVYDHIDHIRVGEAKRVVEMMWQYGAGSHNKEQYQSLMMRLNTWMMRENPTGYDNYEIVGWSLYNAPSGHAHIEWYILTSIISHAHFKIIDDPNNWRLLFELCRSNSRQIYIFGLSKWAFVDREGYESWHPEIYQEYDKENYLAFLAAGNVKEDDWWFVNKICQEDYDLFDDHTWYDEWSRTHSRNDVVLDRHLMLTVSTDNNGDIDQTNERGESSIFPIGFHDKVLFSGRILPFKRNLDDKVGAPDGKYNTSFTNYVNVALADLCFQLYAEVADVDELLEMIRSTAFTDHIRFDLNGDGDTNDIVDGQRETQPLQLINPGGLYKKYLIPKSIPSSLSLSETLELKKGYYKGVVFNIPGAEVKVDGEWIPFTADNASRIKAANPMNLEWRLNGTLLRKYGCTPGQTLQGQIITVDDQWNGLRLEVPISITIR